MGLMDLLLGRPSAAAAKVRNSKPAHSVSADSQQTQGGGSAQSVRKDLLKLALRETLTRSGIPPTWLTLDMLRTTSVKKEAGLHVRFLVRHWDPRLLVHGVALEQEFTNRLLLLDPAARSWLMGFSWQFALADTTACPPLPQSNFWTAPPSQSQPAPVADREGPVSGVGVIEGPPASASRPLDDVRGDLERLLALRDEDMKKHNAERAYAPTRPATL